VTSAITIAGIKAILTAAHTSDQSNQDGYSYNDDEGFDLAVRAHMIVLCVFEIQASCVEPKLATG